MIFSKRVLGVQESFLNKWDSDIKRRIAEGEDILQFNLGQPDFPLPEFVKEAIVEAKEKDKNNFYNHTGGTDGLRSAVAGMEEKLSGLAYQKEEIIITNGAKEAIFLALAAVLNAGDEVIIIAPAWPTYIEAVKFLGGVPVVLDADADFHPDLEAIKRAVNAKTRAIIINSPNNPTGVIYGEEELKEVAQMVIANDLLIISDEVYSATIFDEREHFSVAKLPDMKARTVVVDGFSKTLSMTGFRLGYAASSREMIDAMIKVKSNINGNTNSFFQVVLEDVIAHRGGDFQDFIDYARQEYLRRRDFLCGRLREMGMEYTRPEGAFYVFAKIPEGLHMKSKKFAGFLADKAGVAVAPGIFFGQNFDNYFRISFGASIEDLEKGMEKVKKIL